MEPHPKQKLLWDAEDAIERLRIVGDLVLAAYFGASTRSDREALRERYRIAVVAWLRDEVPLPPDVVGARNELRRVVPAFHWMLELPEVFHEGRVDPLDTSAGVSRLARMDSFAGNMPFIGGRRIATIHGERYAEWLCEAFDGTGEVDYVAYFFLRANQLLGTSGTIGLIPTQSISQGDTRRMGLQRLLSNGLVIYDARTRLPWPGPVGVFVSPTALAKGTSRDHIGLPRLNGMSVATINSRLRSYAEREDPRPLAANEGIAFVGCFLRGEGFVLSREEASALLVESPAEKAVVRPYLVGEDITKDRLQRPARFVIDFAVMDIEDARRFKKSIAVLEERVRPDRERLRTTGADASHRRNWWRFANTRNDLRAWLAGHPECLVLPRVAKHLLVARTVTDQVFSEQVVVFGLSDASALGLLQSRVHEVWVRLLSSTMGEGLRYSASDCFDTFPFPGRDARAGIPALANAATRLEELRASYMVDEGVGLTATYNRLKNPEEVHPRILMLRRAHEENDAEVLRAYDDADPTRQWSEVLVPPFCPKNSTESAQVEAFEDAVISRLFALNAERAREEEKAEASASPAKKPKPSPKPSAPKTADAKKSAKKNAANRRDRASGGS